MAFTSPSVTQETLAPACLRQASVASPPGPADRSRLMHAMAEYVEVRSLLREGASAEQRGRRGSARQSERVPAGQTDSGFCHDGSFPDASCSGASRASSDPQLGSSGFTRCTTEAMATSGVFMPSTAASASSLKMSPARAASSKAGSGTRATFSTSRSASA